ncbi:hypothetical protein PROFUN_03985 [Planoprotostelium fungivorum]|uniref:Uncharacterized protein n=1 Tax=Planoprotostelium fungivorum TaxID=1890364 RepID=A0A2P6NW26_9EUKA|nr:hypothetical protein PROFUN_03985 [Planoprotostelium fungivorum]
MSLKQNLCTQTRVTEVSPCVSQTFQYTPTFYPGASMSNTFYLLFSMLPLLVHAQSLTSLTSSPRVDLNATNNPLRSLDGNWSLSVSILTAIMQF